MRSVRHEELHSANWASVKGIHMPARFLTDGLWAPVSRDVPRLSSCRTRSERAFGRPVAPRGSMICVICDKSPRRAFSLPCGHAYCDTCAAAALWDSPRCVSCGAAATSATCLRTDAGDAATISVRHRGVTFSVDLAPDDDLHLRVSRMFAVPLDRLKLISQGKVLARDLPSPRPGAVVQLIGTRQEMQLHGEQRAAHVRRWEALRESAELVTMSSMLAAAAAAQLRAWQGVRRTLIAAGRGTILFFASLLPAQVARAVLPQAIFPDAHQD